jgi:hypothetical protein
MAPNIHWRKDCFFYKWFLGKELTICQRLKLNPVFPMQNKLQMDQRSKCQRENFETSKRIDRETFHSIDLANIFKNSKRVFEYEIRNIELSLTNKVLTSKRKKSTE